jgi:hypothetical protein
MSPHQRKGTHRGQIDGIFDKVAGRAAAMAHFQEQAIGDQALDGGDHRLLADLQLVGHRLLAGPDTGAIVAGLVSHERKQGLARRAAEQALADLG